MTPAPALTAPRLLCHLARTGGTLIARILGSMESVVLLSEVHPRAGPGPVLAQAQAWHGLVDDTDASAVNRLAGLPPAEAFREAVALVQARAAARGRVLVLRDWTHLDFHGVPKLTDPAYRLTTAAVLAPRWTVPLVVTVRHPIDQWQSAMTRRGLSRTLTLDHYLDGLARFARLVAPLGVMRYEDLVADPHPWVETLCRRLAVPCDPAWPQRWAANRRVTGDLDQPSRGGGLAVIEAPERRPLDPETRHRFDTSPLYHEVCALFGYAA
ncbi:sulfotransferase [Roseospira goensis]|uniref:Sulfotransferase family protein n=1 Tax=Roseospira goensis TaxID=391922 RepID=A0A7W6RXX8_9PROT|nr:sulfotransferase [Roseospira goensis]MBB4284619.1 hypothetical protein [Roseospira goensis]